MLPWTQTLRGSKWKHPPPILKHDLKVINTSNTSNTSSKSNTLRKDSLTNMTLLQGNNTFPVKVLLDTGASCSNFVSRNFINKHKIVCNTNNIRLRVCSAFSSNCRNIETVSNLLTLRFFNELIQDFEVIQINGYIIDIDDEIIIGKQTMKKHDLQNKMYHQIWNTTVPYDQLKQNLMGTQVPQDINCLLKTINAEFEEKRKFLSSSNEDNDSDDNSENHLVDEEDIEFLIPDTNTCPQLRELCIEYQDIFKTSLQEQSINLEPLELNVDFKKWEIRRNSGAPRVQSIQAQIEIRKQVEEMLKNGIIQPSKATFYSQVLLVPKPNQTWRFCIDYRYLNSISTYAGMNFPLPNIDHTIQRIGQHKPKYFAILDLTSGYYQLWMKESCRKFTAFICFIGIFEYVSMPFGLKGAPSHFQRIMSQVVLAGLIYIICEIYIDDCIVYGESIQQLEQRLRMIFDRMRLYNLKLNPKKCKIGVTQIEYLGHVIIIIIIKYLLRDMEFVILTDHRNLLFEEKDEPSPKVIRWKMFISLFNFKMEHIKGVENIAADAYSRLCTLVEANSYNDTRSDPSIVLANLSVPTEKLTTKIPNDLYRSIYEVHNAMEGHFGVEETYNRLKKNHGHNKNLKNYVKQFIERCAFCQKNS